jgi:UDP-N-acetylmuramyl pentapeptide phosphotransferase/UDP-N-acetylglucosamine-1-phosphate transferase
LASGVIFLVGLIDDIRGLRPLLKLAGQIAAACIVCLSGTRFGNVLGLELPAFLDAALAIVWLVAVMNAFNLIDGLDGLASGLAAISGLGLCGVFAVTHLPGNVLVLAALVGASLAFLRYNFHPASIFLGDCGSLFLGFTLGVVSLQTFTKSTFLLSLTIPILLLGVPIYDEFLAVWRRSIRRVLNRQLSKTTPSSGVMQPDLDHLHHRLLKAGWSTSRAALVLCLVNAVLVVCGLVLVMFRSRASGIYLLVFLIAVYVLLRHLAVIELRDTGRVLLNGLRRPSHATIKMLGFPSWDMFWMSASIALALAATGPTGPGFWRAWFLDLPLWVTPTFTLLAISRVYITVWSRVCSSASALPC